MGLLLAYSNSKGHARDNGYERVAFLSVDTNSGRNDSYSRDTNRQTRWSADSGQGSDEHAYSPRSGCSSFEHDRQEAEDMAIPNLESNNKPSCRRLSPFGSLDRYLTARVPQLTSQRVLSALSLIHTIIERTILILGFFALTSGGVVYTGIFVSTAGYSPCHGVGLTGMRRLARTTNFQRAGALHQGRDLHVVWILDSRPVAWLLCRLWMGVECEAITCHRRGLEIKNTNRRIHRIVCYFLIWSQQHVFGASWWVGRTMDGP